MDNSTNLVPMKNVLKPYEDKRLQTYSQTLPTRKERLDGVKFLILRRLEDSGQKQLPDEILKQRTISYEKHLTNKGVMPEDYDKVYEIAVQNYNKKGGQGPFGIDELLQAADLLFASRQNAKRFEPLPKVAKRNCPVCKGTTLKYKLVDGVEKIDYTTDESGKKVARRCEECYES